MIYISLKQRAVLVAQFAIGMLAMLLAVPQVADAQVVPLVILSCGNGVCDTSNHESCTTCAADCGPCRLCGDGVCRPAEGESCDACNIDCGVCPPIRPSEVVRTVIRDPSMDRMDARMRRLQQEQGSESEHEGLARDPRLLGNDGTCGGRLVPGEIAAGVSFNPRRLRVESPSLFNLGAGCEVEGNLGYSASVNTNDLTCTQQVQAGLALRQCIKAGRRETCTEFALDVSGGSTKQWECNRGVPRCFGRSCSNINITGRVGRTVEWFFGRQESCWTVGAGFGLGIEAALGVGAEWGEACSCDNNQDWDGTRFAGSFRVTGPGTGRAEASFKKWGARFGVGLNITACVNGGLQGRFGACGGDPSLVGGIALTAAFEGVRVGWFRLGSFSLRWATGSGC